MTPYAALLCLPTDNDVAVRKAFHELAKRSHEDAAGAQDPQLWALASEAYALLKTEPLRVAWWALQKKLSGLCPDCRGYGVLGTRSLGKTPCVCNRCKGEGRQGRAK